MKRGLLVLLFGLVCAGCQRGPREARVATSPQPYVPYGIVDPKWHPLPFDSERWKAADEHGRFDMLQDLVEHHLREGTSGAELETLLGPLEQGWSDPKTGQSYVFWVERPPFREPADSALVVPVAFRSVIGLRLDLVGDRLTRWELIKP